MSGPLDFDDAPREAPAGPAPEREADERRDREGGPRAQPPRKGRYGWALALLVLVILVYITVNNLTSDGPGSTGPPVGERMPDFAVPLALSSLSGDANVATQRGQGSAGAVPACQVRGADVLNVCTLEQGHPVVLAFMASSGDVCIQQLDAMERVRGEFPGVRFAAVAIRGDRGELRSLVRRHGWGFPVGYDRDGEVSNIYGIAVCPELTFAYPGGIVMHNVTGGLQDEAALRRQVRALVQRSEARGWQAPR